MTPCVEHAEEKVRDIKKQLAEGVTLKNIAAQYGVHFGTIFDIKRKKSWKHI